MKCCVKNCENKKGMNNQHTLFSFPSDEKLLKKWLKFTKRTDPFNKKTWRVCEEHFNPEDVHGRMQCDLGFRSRLVLKTGAVPCINKNDVSLLDQFREEKRKNKQLVEELLADAERAEDYAKTVADKVHLKPRVFDDQEDEESPLKEPQVDIEFNSDTVLSQDSETILSDELLDLENDVCSEVIDIEEKLEKDNSSRIYGRKNKQIVDGQLFGAENDEHDYARTMSEEPCTKTRVFCAQEDEASPLQEPQIDFELDSGGVVSENSKPSLSDCLRDLQNEVCLGDVLVVEDPTNANASYNLIVHQQPLASTDLNLQAVSTQNKLLRWDDVIVLDTSENNKTDKKVLEASKFSKKAATTIFYTGQEISDSMKKCRICARYFIADANAKDLFDETNGALLYNIEAVTGIMIQLLEGLPHYICSGCFSDLGRATAFRENCIRSEEILSLQIQEQEQIAQSIEIIEDVVDHENCEELQRKQIFDHLGHNGVQVELEPILKNDATTKEKPPETPSNADPLCVGVTESNINILLREANGAAKRVKRMKTKKEGERPKRKRKPKERKPRKVFTPEERRLRKKMQNSNLNIVCDICGHISGTRNGFTMHKLRHTGTKNFACSECPKKFYQNCMLQLHIRVVHKHERPFHCRYCELTFGDNGARYKHEAKMHGVGKKVDTPSNNECDICGFISSNRTSLNMHKLRHTGTKNFQCPECPMKFYQNFMMQVHVRVKHRNEKPFSCRHCEKKYTTPTKRYLHERKIHGIQPKRVRSTIRPAEV